MTLVELFVIFMGLMFLGMPIAFSMGVAATLTLIHLQVVPLILVPQRLFVTINSFPLMAVPFFIIAGLLMNEAGITRRLVARAYEPVESYPDPISRWSRPKHYR